MIVRQKTKLCEQTRILASEHSQTCQLNEVTVRVGKIVDLVNYF